MLFGMATSGTGIEELTDVIIALLPSPSEVAGKRAEEQGAADDPFVGELSYFRVMAGTLKSDSHVWNSGEGEDERVGQVFVVTGKETEAVPELGPGDIGAVSKLNSVQTGHTLTEKDRPVTLAGAAFPTPIYRMAVYPTAKTDVDKLTTALARIAEEDPTLLIER